MKGPLVLSLIIGVAILAVLGVVIAIYIKSKTRNEQTEIDYRVFFILGISLLPVGIATDNPGMWGIGAVFLILGLVNRDKWKAEPKWSELDPEKRKRIVFFIILGLAMLLALGAVLIWLARSM
jgi:flagellar basal body-associated protein FliL